MDVTTVLVKLPPHAGLVLGGAGYLGSRLCLPPDWLRVDVGAYPESENLQFLRADVRDLDLSTITGPVVYLTSTQMGRTADMDPDTLARLTTLTWGITSHFPDILAQRLEDQGLPMLYVSSMRVITAPHSEYGQAKKWAEIGLRDQPNVSIVRFGTVYGGTEEPEDPKDRLPVRLDTAVNFAKANGFFAGKEWTGHVTHLYNALLYIDHWCRHPWTAHFDQVINCKQPWGADDVRIYAAVGEVGEVRRPHYDVNGRLLSLERERERERERKREHWRQRGREAKGGE